MQLFSDIINYNPNKWDSIYKQLLIFEAKMRWRNCRVVWMAKYQGPRANGGPLRPSALNLRH
jgi:hypothetical protein